MNGGTLRSRIGRLSGVALAVAAGAGLLYAATRDATGEEPTFLHVAGVASMVALTIWAFLAARNRIKRQPPAEIEQLPAQPGDREIEGRRPVVQTRIPRRKLLRSRARAKAAERALLSAAPEELSRLLGKIRAGTSSESAYVEHIEPLIREIRERRFGRRHDDVGTIDGLSGLRMRVPAYRKRTIARAVRAIIRSIEES